MTTPEQRWDGPIQDAIRRHDEKLGHIPPVPAVPPVADQPWFRRMPNGGTVHIDWFRHAPNGGATVYVEPSRSGNPYARIDEDTSLPRPVVTVELPPFEEDR